MLSSGRESVSLAEPQKNTPLSLSIARHTEGIPKHEALASEQNEAYKTWLDNYGIAQQPRDA